MKRFKMKQKIFAIAREYHILDEHDQMLYRAKGKMFSPRAVVNLYDTTTNELLFTKKKKLFAIMAEHTVYDSMGKHVARMKQKFTIGRKLVHIDGDFGHIEVRGNFWALNFSMHRDDQLLVSVDKKYFQIRDTYNIEIHAENKKEIEFLLMCVVMIDSKFHENKKNN